MGNEMECVCDSCTEDQQNTDLKNNSPYEFNQEMRKSFAKESFISSLDVLYSYVSNHNSLSTKASLIKSSALEAFFYSKSNLLIQTKLEVNYYYNRIVVSNYLSKNSIAFVILQDVKTGIDEETLCSFNNRAKAQGMISIKKKDNKILFKVEKINLMSLNKDKIKEQLLNDFNLKLQRQYALNGIIVYDDAEEGLDQRHGSYYPNASTKITQLSDHFHLNGSTIQNDFLVLYRKCKADDYNQYQYYLDFLEDEMNTDSVTKMLFKHQNDKELVSVIQTGIANEHSDKHNSTSEKYCFIFKKYKNRVKKVLDDDDSFEYIVFDFTPGHSSFEAYLKDICDKISIEKKAILVALVNAKDKFYLIFRLDFESLETE